MNLMSGCQNKPIIVILLGAPFTLQNYERTGVPYLKEDFEVIVLDCNPWLREQYESLIFNPHNYQNILTISSADEFRTIIGKLKPDYALDNINDIETKRFIQNILRLHGTKYVIPATGRLPHPSKKQRLIEYFVLAFRSPKQFLAKVISRVSIYVKGKRVLAPDIALLAGKSSLDSYTTKAKNILWVASGDYFVYKMIEDSSLDKNRNPPVQGKYVLFIDDCVAVATDYVLLGTSQPVDAESYFSLLRLAFDKFELITGMQVVIAAHPHGKDIRNYGSFFGDRQVFFDITGELCRHSTLVFSHISTAMSYAVLWEKPLIILTSEALDKSWIATCIRTFSSYLNCPLLFMESDVLKYQQACQQSKNIDRRAYRSFVDNFIKSEEATEAAPWQAFSDFVKQQANEI